MVYQRSLRRSHASSIMPSNGEQRSAAAATPDQWKVQDISSRQTEDSRDTGGGSDVPAMVEGLFGSQAAGGVELEQAIEQRKSLGRERVAAVMHRSRQREQIAQPVPRLRQEVVLRAPQLHTPLSSRSIEYYYCSTYI